MEGGLEGGLEGGAEGGAEAAAAEAEVAEVVPEAAPARERGEWRTFTEEACAGRTTALFTRAGYYHPAKGKPRTPGYVPTSGITNHGIRASAAQWAARCGASLIQIKAMGRWKNTDVCAHYMAQGNEESDRATVGGNGEVGDAR